MSEGQPKDGESPTLELLDLPAVVAPKGVTGVPDKNTAGAIEELERAAKPELARLAVESRQQDITARKLYAGLVFRLICWWLGAILLLVFLDGACANSNVDKGFELDDSVLIALITTTTAGVLGLFTIVAKYIFRVDP